MSKNIKLLRGQRSLSQVELAEKADISIPFLSNIERSNKWPHPDTLVKIATALDVEVFTLFQNNRPSLPVNIQNTLKQFKKDMELSLNKTVLTAIDCSLETVSSQYIKDKK